MVLPALVRQGLTGAADSKQLRAAGVATVAMTVILVPRCRCRAADAAPCRLPARPLPALCLQVLVRKAYNELYAAVIDKKVAMKMGPGDWRWVL